MTGKQILLHTLSLPEYVWLDFFREFFTQKQLFFGEDQQSAIPNRFFYDKSDVNNRRFTIEMAYDFDTTRENALPALILEDTGCQQLGLTINQMKSFSNSPSTVKERADQLRHTYVFHCLSSKRGESRLLASAVAFAITAFRDQILKQPGMVKIEPFSIGATQPIRSDSAEDFVDTPVQVTFEVMEFWRTVEIGSGDAEQFNIVFTNDQRSRYIRAGLTVADPRLQLFVRAALTVANPSLAKFVRASMTTEDPLSSSRFIRSSLVSEDPSVTQSYVRASMRVS